MIDELSRGKTQFMGIVCLDNSNNRTCNRFAKIDIHFTPMEWYPFQLLYFSSGEYFSRDIRQISKKKGYKLSDKNITAIDIHHPLDKNKIKIKNKIKTEKDIFDFLNIKYISPNKR